jgi:hypothetical protein
LGLSRKAMAQQVEKTVIRSITGSTSVVQLELQSLQLQQEQSLQRQVVVLTETTS